MSHVGVPTWWCNEVVDELEGQCVSHKDLADMGIGEPSMMKSSPSVVAPTAATLVYRPKVLGFVLEVVRELVTPPENSLFVAQVLDVTSFWVSSHDLPSTSDCRDSAVHVCQVARQSTGTHWC